jgi:hypothetical protein
MDARASSSEQQVMATKKARLVPRVSPTWFLGAMLLGECFPCLRLCQMKCQMKTSRTSECRSEEAKMGVHGY